MGFCFTNDLICSADEVSDISYVSTENSPFLIGVNLTIPSLTGKHLRRGETLTASSGAVSRKTILDDMLHNITPIRSQERFKVSIIEQLPDKLNACQILRSKCGATHGSALFDKHGEPLFCAEDVGRHNGLDKLIGFMVLHRITASDKLLVLSSRASFEMIQKAVRMSIPVIASVSAPTELALRVADQLHCTYISFLKKGGFYIYTHPWRLESSG